MVDAKSGIDDIDKFVNKLRLSKSANIMTDDKSKDLYRKFHALLCWQPALDNNADLKQTRYFEEFLSDCASSYFLMLTSAYKPSISMLRSSIENLVRTILILDGVGTTKIEAVWELFTTARTHFNVQDNAACVERIDAVHQLYGEMCKTVHSSSMEYMSLRIPFERMFEFDKNSYSNSQKMLKETFRLALEILYLTSRSLLNGLHHRISDEIKDAISPTTKALVA